MKTMLTFLNDLLLLQSSKTLYMILKVCLLSIGLGNLMHVNTLTDLTLTELNAWTKL